MTPKEIAKDLNITPMLAGRLRKRACGDEDVDGNDILPSGMAKIAREVERIYGSAKRSDPEDAPDVSADDALPEEFVKFRVTQLADNPIYVYGYPEGWPKAKHRCHIPRQLRNRLRPGMKFDAQMIRADGKPSFRHERCRRNKVR